MQAQPRSPRGLLPLLLVVATGLTALGAWSIVVEGRAVRAGIVERLRSRAAAAAADVESEAARLTREVLQGRGALVDAEGRFVDPPTPRTMKRLDAASPVDEQGRWLLALAAENEQPGGDINEALRLYSAASAPTREPACRAIASARLAALYRRDGKEAEARRADAVFLSQMRGDAPVGRELALSVEGLVARTLERSEREGLRADLLASLGSPDEAIALGLLRQAGLDDPEPIRSRRAELAAIEGLKPHIEGILASEEGHALAGETLLAWQRQEDGSTRIASTTSPVLPEGVRLVLSNDSLEIADALVEELSLAPLLPGASVVAVLPRSEARREALTRQTLLALGLVILLSAVAAAFFATWRGWRREREAADQQTAFLARVGHDLRTPLSVIRMYAETLAANRVDNPEEAREFAGVVAREAERLGGMVGSVLDLAKTGTVGGLRAAPVDLVRLTRETTTSHAALCAESGVELTFEPPAKDADSVAPIRVLGDGDALRGALGNLIENCLHHASAGGICAVRVEQIEGEAVLSVADRGPGFDAGLRTRAFERFVRGDGVNARGAGLGLALVREVAEAHGGEVTAEDREGGGTLVRLTLPLAPADACDGNPPERNHTA